MKILEKLGFKLFFAALNIIEKKFITKISDPTLQDSIRILMTPTKDIVNVLRDANTKDGEQIKEILQNFIASKKLGDFLQETMRIYVGKIKQEEAKLFAAAIVDEVVATIQALADSDPENATQIKEIWVSWLRSADALDSVMEIVEKAIAGIKEIDDTIKPLIVEAIRKALEEAQK